MLQIIFGDDEHTAADGPYSRVLKTRKWVYLSATVATLLSTRLYDADAASALLRVIDVPWWLLSKATLAGGLYLLLQYGLLTRQLHSVYDLVLEERLTFRRAEELRNAQERLDKQRRSVIDRHTKLLNAEDEKRATFYKDRSTLLNEADRLKVVIKTQENGYGPVAEEKLRQAQEKLKQVEKNLSYVTKEAKVADEELAALSRTINTDDDPEVTAAKTALDELRRQDPADRKGYRQSEIAVDAVRILAPALFGIFSVVNLAIAIFRP